MREYVVIIEPAEDGSGYGAYVPDLPGCVATGASREEAMKRISFSLPLHIESLKAHGEPIPAPAAIAERVSVAA